MSEIEEVTASDEMNVDFCEENDNEAKNGDRMSAEEEHDFKRSPKRRKKLIIFLVIAVVAAVLIIVGIIVKSVKNSGDSGPKYKDAAVERRTISNMITGSSSIEPNDSYSVTTIKSGDIDADYFKEGDTVKKGDKLYQFDDDDAQKSLTTAKNAVTKAQLALNDAQDSSDKQYVKSDIAGKIKEVYVSAGDNVSNGAKIADVYNDSTMKLVLPFNTGDAANVSVGANAEISVSGENGTINGKVTGKSSSASATDYHTSVVYVTIELTNPGALTEADLGSAVINGAACSDSANFQYINSHTVVAEAAGTVERVNVVAGDGVSKGTQLAYINSTQAQNSLKNAKLSLDDANIQLKKAEDAVDDYLIEAPIDGTVVTKNAKAGDTVDTSNSQTPLCVIYDLSCVKFNIDVDETEIALVKTGQKVKVTADAADGEFEGKVVKVPVDGVNENGVTTYTVEVQIDNYGDLLPGMNINAEITVEEAANVLAVPVNSVNRGDIVFVKDDGKTRENDVTDTINGSKKSEGSEDKREVSEKKDKESDKAEGEHSGGAAPTGMPTSDNASQNLSNIPANIEIPEGYRAVKVETGINDTEYIEIKSGLSEGDTVRALDTESSSANASFGSGEDAMSQMGGMGGSMSGPSGGMGGPGGGMGGSGGGSRGGMGGPGGGMR